MTVFHPMKQNDRRPYVRHTLYNNNGSRVDLSTADRVGFTMVTSDRKTVVISDADALVEDAAEGEVRYEWADGDTDTIGDYLAWWTVYWDPVDDTDRETFPNDEGEYIEITVGFGNDT